MAVSRALMNGNNCVRMDRNSSEWVSHFCLFQKEILNFLSDDDEFILFEKFSEAHNISTKFLEQPNYAEFRRVVSHSRELREFLINVVCRKNYHLYEEINRPIRKESLFYYSKFLNGDGICIIAIIASLDPFALVRQLPSVYTALIDKFGMFQEEKDEENASCFLMRSLPYEGDIVDDAAAWYFDFCNACLRDSDNCTIPEFVDPNYEEGLTVYNSKVTLINACKAVSESEGDVNALGVIEEEVENEHRPCRDQKDFKKYRFLLVSEETLASLPDPENIELRLYQEELVAAAERGANTIICAPTGSGKTVVAAHIIINHLLKLRAEGKVGRVAMLVPTVPLVEQQSTLLNNFMRKKFWIEGLTGGEPIFEDGRAPFVLASDVTVFTPQILINLLKSVRKDDRLYFNDFTMFIFDECHHCDREHPYNVLMRMLHDFEGRKPQIVGLTATLPLGSGRLSAEAALDRMLELCVRLSAHSITSVRKFTNNLESYVTPPVDEVIQLKNSCDNRLTIKLIECMVQIEKEVSKELKRVAEENNLSFREKEIIFPTQQSSVFYEGFVGSLKAHLKAEMRGRDNNLQLIKTLDHLWYFHCALCLNNLLPDRYAYAYLEDKISKENIPEDGTGLSVQERTKSLFQECILPIGKTFSSHDNGETKELLRYLHEILRQQYSKEPNSRTIIFVATRFLAEKLADHLNQACILGSNRSVGYITSSNQTSATSGQSLMKQRNTIESFNNGLIKILVSTAVAEEGMDISTCNLIIKYNNAGSERSLIQRRGRARAKNSRSILLVLDGFVEERELENIQKEQLMRLCLAHIQTKSEEQMKALINEKLEEERNLRERYSMENEEQIQMLGNKIYNLYCRSCGAFICKSKDMRLTYENQYVCCDPAVWQRIGIEVLKRGKTLNIAILVGKSFCKDDHCAAPLGIVIKLFGAFLPAFNAESLVVDDLEDTNIYVYKFKKWDDMIRGKFFVEDLTERDLKVMLKWLYKFAKKKHDELEAEAQNVMHRALTAINNRRSSRHLLEK